MEIQNKQTTDVKGKHANSPSQRIQPRENVGKNKEYIKFNSPIPRWLTGVWVAGFVDLQTAPQLRKDMVDFISERHPQILYEEPYRLSFLRKLIDFFNDTRDALEEQFLFVIDWQDLDSVYFFQAQDTAAIDRAEIDL